MNKPCPFCGCDDEMLEVTRLDYIGAARKRAVECVNCGAQGPTHFNAEGEEAAIEGAWFNWNDRPESSVDATEADE